MPDVDDAPSGEWISPSLSRIHWRWIGVGLVIGGVLIGTIIPIVSAIPPRPDVAILLTALAFSLTGVLVGYLSPGSTVHEAAITGLALAIIVPVVVWLGWGFALDPRTAVLGVPAGVALGAAGGWVGEIMQGTLKEDEHAGIQWSWVTVGTALGVLASVYVVFVPNALLELSSLQTLLLFLGSFFITAFAVAFLSPGATILEPAAAAGLAIMIDALLALVGLHVPFPFMAVLIASAMAFVIGVAGAYVGEVAHNLYFQTAWGGTFRGVEVPKPGKRE